MALMLEARSGEYMTGRGVKRLFDELCDGIFRELRRLPAVEGQELLAELRGTLDGEIATEQQFQEEFSRLQAETLRTATPEELARICREIVSLVAGSFLRHESVPALFALCGEALESMLEQALRLTEEELTREGLGPPPCYAWLLLGPGGRREATLSTELEGVLVHGPGETATRYCAELAGRTTVILERCGFKKSRRGIIPDNPLWRASTEGWLERIEELCCRDSRARSGSSPHRMARLGSPLFELADLRFAAGDSLLGEELIIMVRNAAERHPACIMAAARTVAALPTPFTFLGNYRVERKGNHLGMVDLDRWACHPLVAMVRLQAVTGGIAETSTLERLQALLRRGSLDVELGKRLLKAGLRLFRLKALLEIQGATAEGDGTYLLPSTLSSGEEFELREALEAVTTLRKVIHSSLAEKG